MQILHLQKLYQCNALPIIILLFNSLFIKELGSSHCRWNAYHIFLFCHANITCWQFLEAYFTYSSKLIMNWESLVCLDDDDLMHHTQNGDAQCANKRPCFVHAWHASPAGWLGYCIIKYNSPKQCSLQQSAFADIFWRQRDQAVRALDL